MTRRNNKVISRSSDFQQKKLYIWEREEVFPLDDNMKYKKIKMYSPLTLNTVKSAGTSAGFDTINPLPWSVAITFCSVLLRDYGVDPNSVVIVKTPEKSRVASAWRNRLEIPMWARTFSYLLHELAHVILKQRDMCDHHGPEFVKLYIELLTKYMEYPESMLRKSAFRYGVQVAA